MKKILSLLGVLIAIQGMAQQKQEYRTGKLFFNWGYNRSWYGKSDIHLEGPGYDYTIHDAKADDDPQEVSSVYFDPGKFTVPQFTFRAGYYINEHWSVSAGWDHMKYVLRNGQTAKVSGEITADAIDDYAWMNDPSVAQYIGEYDDEDVYIGKDFLKYEHTDGLNFIRVAVDRTDELLRLANGKVGVIWQNSLGTGPVLPWTDFTLLSGKRYKNRLHFSGWGVGVHTGVKIEFLKSFYLQTQVGAGYINLFDVETKMHESDKATQEIKYIEWDFVAGFYLNWKRILKVGDYKKTAEN